MAVNPKQGRVLFIDDEKDAVEAFVQHLRDEGFAHVELMTDVKSLNQVVQANADVVFLDITGVASALDAAEEGLSVLEYLKKHRPWARVVVLSGSDFPASKAKQLNLADLCITKASLNLAELVNVAEDQLRYAVLPEYRNALIMKELAKHIDELKLSWWNRRKLKRLVSDAQTHEGNAGYNWGKLATNTKELVGFAASVARLIEALG